jgi:hypothetical protein
MDSANQIFGGLIGLFIFACVITLVIYWIAFPIMATRYLAGGAEKLVASRLQKTAPC